MTTIASDAVLRERLLDRRQRLSQAAGLGHQTHLRELLHQVDSALEKMEVGGYGVCEICHGPINRDRLLADPVTSVCLECFTPEQRRDLERDLQTAADIQAALFPQRGLAVPGWRLDYHLEPLGPVSGDYCDWMQAPGSDDFFFLFGDVAGKGVAASLLTAHLHALFRTLIGSGVAFDEMLVRANRLFCESTMSNSYATLVVGRLRPDGRVELANAGHPAPLWQNGRESRAFSPTGLPFGMFCGSDFDVHRFEMSSGDVLFFYTDGLSEARNRQGEEYGHSRLFPILRGAQSAETRSTLETCIQDLNEFLDGSPRSDDLTVMVIQRT